MFRLTSRPTARGSTTIVSRVFRLNTLVLFALATGCLCPCSGGETPPVDSGRLGGSYRFERAGWIYVHLEGSPEQIGYQHGSLLAHEIADFLRVIKPYLEKSSGATGVSTARRPRQMLWKRHRSRISARDRRDRGGLESRKGSRPIAGTWSHSTPTRSCRITMSPGSKRRRGSRRRPTLPATVAPSSRSGSHTKDGRIVMGHNAWTNYVVGTRWNVVFDIKPDGRARASSWTACRA